MYMYMVYLLVYNTYLNSKICNNFTVFLFLCDFYVNFQLIQEHICMFVSHYYLT